MFNYGAMSAQIALHDELEPIPDLLGEYHVIYQNQNYHHPKGAKNTSHHPHRRKGNQSHSQGQTETL